MKFLEEFKIIDSSREKCREFGYVVGGVLALIALLLWWKGKNWVPLTVIALCLSIPALVAPQILKPIQKVWMGFAVIMGFMMARVILALLFYLVITPFHFFAKIAGKKLLDLDFKIPGDTYWNKYEDKPFNREQYEKQF